MLRLTVYILTSRVKWGWDVEPLLIQSGNQCTQNPILCRTEGWDLYQNDVCTNQANNESLQVLYGCCCSICMLSVNLLAANYKGIELNDTCPSLAVLKRNRLVCVLQLTVVHVYVAMSGVEPT